MRSSNVLAALVAVALSACTGLVPAPERETFQPSPLEKKLLIPRPGHEGKLTNRVCLEYLGKTCVRDVIFDYDLADADFRAQANELHFVCRLGGRMFHICRDRAGFCRYTRERKCTLKIFCRDGDRLTEFYPADPYQKLIDADLECFNEDIYPWDAMK